MFGSHGNEGDPRVKRALDKLDMKYEIQSDGDFKFIFELTDSRTQVGFIRSQTYEFSGIEVREIYSPAIHTQHTLDGNVAVALLKQNENVKVGAWGIISGDGAECIACFTAKISADLPARQLARVIIAVLKTADDAEKRFTDSDNF